MSVETEKRRPPKGSGALDLGEEVVDSVPHESARTSIVWRPPPRRSLGAAQLSA